MRSTPASAPALSLWSLSGSALPPPAGGQRLLCSRHRAATPTAGGWGWRALAAVGTVVSALLAGCSSTPSRTPAAPGVSGSVIEQGASRWVPVPWTAVPGFADDRVGEAWHAWLRSCAKPGPVFARVCREAASLRTASDADKRRWMMERLQPYRVESHGGNAQGLLTSYYEPVLEGSRRPTSARRVPIYGVPLGGAPRSPWFTRQQIETDPQAQSTLRGREILYLADPIDAMILHVQGSGRLRVTEPDGRQRDVRLAYAGTNNRPFRSPSAWVSAHGGRGGSWNAIRTWAVQHPELVQEMTWSNPRYVFFREEPISALDADAGPRGAQGVPLTPGRSIAVDRSSIPYGTPVWLSSSGPTASLHRLVLAQDTGNAIRGAVRADYFAGWSPEAADLAHRLRQPLQLWVLWPR